MGKRRRGPDIPDRLFCDASFLIAYFAAQDECHSRALKIRQKLRSKKVTLVTSWPSISEAGTLLLYHYGYSHAVALLSSLEVLTVLIPSETEYHDAAAHFKNFNRDQKLSFNDLLSYVMIRGRLQNTPILTFDRDFSRMGLTVFSP